MGSNERFVSAVLQASPIAVKTHQTEKRRALRNAVLNVAKGPSIGDDKEAFFLRLVDAFTVTHLELLSLFKNRAAFSLQRMRQLEVQRHFTDPIVLDLDAHGLLIDHRPRLARTRDGIHCLISDNWEVSPLGNEFFTFISDPVGD